MTPRPPVSLIERLTTGDTHDRAQELCESRGGRPGTNSPYGLCGRKATLNGNGMAVNRLGGPAARC